MDVTALSHLEVIVIAAQTPKLPMFWTDQWVLACATCAAAAPHGKWRRWSDCAGAATYLEANDCAGCHWVFEPH
jgi:hypothetical protein